MRSKTMGPIAQMVAAAAVSSLLAGCTIHPVGEREERKSAVAAGRPFERPLTTRELKPLPAFPSPEDLAQTAMQTSGDLEQRYWQWRAAIEQIPQDGTQSTTINVSLGSAITRGRIDSRNTTLTIGNDPMTDIKWPGKLDAAARAALENARAAGIRFRKAQFELRAKVLDACYDYAMNSELIELGEKSRGLLETAVMASEARNESGAVAPVDVLKARNELAQLKNEIANLRSQLPPERATINALLNRPAEAELAIAGKLPEPRPLAYDDAQLMSQAADRNPELMALLAEIHGKEDVARLATLQRVPDFNLAVSTDLAGIAQTLVGQATLPLLRYEAIDAAISQASANLRGSEAGLRQAHDDLGARVVLDISTIHDADRQLELFRRTILPRAAEIVAVSRSSYETGSGSLLDLLDAQRSSISIERLVVSLRARRARQVADLEAITAHDLRFMPAR